MLKKTVSMESFWTTFKNGEKILKYLLPKKKEVSKKKGFLDNSP